MSYEYLFNRTNPNSEEFVDLNLLFAEKVRSIIKLQGLTQKAFAEKLGKKESEVSRWLSGLHNLTLRNVARIHVALGQRVFQVTGGGTDLCEYQPTSGYALKEKDGTTLRSYPSYKGVDETIPIGKEDNKYVPPTQRKGTVEYALAA